MAMAMGSPTRHAPAASKARSPADCRTLEQLPNIGPSLAADLRSIGITEPRQLVGLDGWTLYHRLCDASGQRQDPCVLDTFLAITDFMRGAPPAPWWHYTARRKREFGQAYGGFTVSAASGAAPAAGHSGRY